MANNSANTSSTPARQTQQSAGLDQSTGRKITPGDDMGTFIQIIGWVVVTLSALGVFAGIINLNSPDSSDTSPLLIALSLAVGIQGFLLVGFGRLISLTGDLKFAAQRSITYLNQGAQDEQLVSILEELKLSSQRSEHYLAELGRLELEKQEHSNRVNTQEAEPAPQVPETPGPADWYPDPSGAAQLRYWDGAAWTDHIHVTGEAS